MTAASIESLVRPDCVIRYRKVPSSDGSWFVFLHGAGVDGHMFDAQLAGLPHDSGAVCWDARAHGSSPLDGPFRYEDMLDDLHALLGTVDATTLTLVGQSMGGNLAQSYVDAHPGTVHRLVLIDCTANHGPISRLELLALRSTGTILRAYPWAMAVRQSARACGVTRQTRAYAERCLRRMGKSRFIEVMGFWHAALRPDPGYGFALPVSMIVGREDRAGNIHEASTALAARDANVRLTVVERAAHNSNMDRPDAVNEVIFSPAL